MKETKSTARLFSVNEVPYSIRCVLYRNDSAALERVVICCHGFAGRKSNAAVRHFAEYMLARHKGLAVLCFDFPCHGEDIRKKLRLEDCTAYLDVVIRYAKTKLCANDLYLNATSFGGYLSLKYIADHGNPFRKIVLRCPAVNMYEVLAYRIMTAEDRSLIEKGKAAETGFDRKIAIDAGFLESLHAADITTLDFSTWAEDILILHGTKDEIVPIDAVRAFAEANQIEFIPVEKADHRFVDPDRMKEAIMLTEAFFEL